MITFGKTGILFEQSLFPVFFHVKWIVKQGHLVDASPDAYNLTLWPVNKNYFMVFKIFQNKVWIKTRFVALNNPEAKG